MTAKPMTVEVRRRKGTILQRFSKSGERWKSVA